MSIPHAINTPHTFQKAGDYFDPYASEDATQELLRIGKMPEALRLADMLEREMQHPGQGRAADCLRKMHAELEAMNQAITDPENQPSQFGTVTMAHMQREVEAEREACARIAETSPDRYHAAATIRSRGQQ